MCSLPENSNLIAKLAGPVAILSFSTSEDFHVIVCIAQNAVSFPPKNQVSQQHLQNVHLFYYGWHDI